jgi:hypothetical protein
LLNQNAVNHTFAPSVVAGGQGWERVRVRVRRPTQRMQANRILDLLGKRPDVRPTLIYIVIGRARKRGLLVVWASTA